MILICYWPPDFPALHPEGKTRWQQFAELDFVGILLLGGGLSVFLVGIGFGGNPYDWTSAAVLCPIILGGLGTFVAFPLWEVYSPDTIVKLCPPHLFQNVRTVVVPYGVTFVAGMALISLGTLWPQQITRLFTTVPETIGWYGLANQGAATSKSSPHSMSQSVLIRTVGLIVAGQTFGSLGKSRWQFIFVVTLMALFLGLNATATQHTPVRAIAFVGVASAMIGAINCFGTLIVQLGARDEDIGLATGLLNSVRAVGGAVGIAIYSSLLSNRISSTWAVDISKAVVQAGLPTSSVANFLGMGSASIHQKVTKFSGALQTANFTSVANVSPAIIEVGLEAQKTVYVDAFRTVYLVTIAFGGKEVSLLICSKRAHHAQVLR
jgi:hypothetical protein